MRSPNGKLEEKNNTDSTSEWDILNDMSTTWGYVLKKESRTGRRPVVYRLVLLIYVHFSLSNVKAIFICYYTSKTVN